MKGTLANSSLIAENRIKVWMVEMFIVLRFFIAFSDADPVFSVRLCSISSEAHSLSC